jgi:signal transduction histidine kinase
LPQTQETQEPASLLEDLKQLKLENSKLARELRITRAYLDKVTKAVEAKDALSQALVSANAKQKAYTGILLESCPNIIILLDDAGRPVLCTRVFLTLTGTPNFDYLVHHTYKDIFAPYVSEEDLKELQYGVEHVVREQKPYVVNKWMDLAKSGENRYYSIELTSIGSARGGDAGIKTGVLVVFSDLTDLMREKQRVETANSIKSDFLAVMSHEIRTPMNAILGLNEILSRTVRDSSQAKHLRDIKKSAQSLLTIINDILDFSKIEAGKMEIINSNYSLRSLLENLNTIFTMLFKEKPLPLVFNLDPRLPDMVYGDENRVRQILTNLLSNAMKYTREGHVDFSASFTSLNDEGTLRFDVKDTGIGIREEDREKLFKPFEQLDIRKNRNVVGTGLGLAICYRLCRLMGGRLSLESEYGRGSTFSVELPFLAPHEEFRNVEEEGMVEFTAPAARVLVVDDIEINLTVCEAMLEYFKIKPDLVQSGRAAIEMAAKNSYDIIFMDHMMPEMDGIESARGIRELGSAGERVPIIALTANVINGAERMFLDNQFNGFLSKPLEIKTLNLCLRKWLPKEKILE